MKRIKSNLYKSEIHELILVKKKIKDLEWIKHKNSDIFFLISKNQGCEIYSTVATIEPIDTFKKKNIVAHIKKMGDISNRNCAEIVAQQRFDDNIEPIPFWRQSVYIFKDFNKKHKLTNNYLLSV